MTKIANYGDDFTEKICLRLSTRQYRYIKQICSYSGLTPSGYIRKLIELSISGGKYEYNLPDCNDQL